MEKRLLAQESLHLYINIVFANEQYCSYVEFPEIN